MSFARLLRGKINIRARKSCDSQLNLIGQLVVFAITLAITGIEIIEIVIYLIATILALLSMFAELSLVASEVCIAWVGRVFRFYSGPIGQGRSVLTTCGRVLLNLAMHYTHDFYLKTIKVCNDITTLRCGRAAIEPYNLLDVHCSSIFQNLPSNAFSTCRAFIKLATPFARVIHNIPTLSLHYISLILGWLFHIAIKTTTTYWMVSQDTEVRDAFGLDPFGNLPIPGVFPADKPPPEVYSEPDGVAGADPLDTNSLLIIYQDQPLDSQYDTAEGGDNGSLVEKNTEVHNDAINGDGSDPLADNDTDAHSDAFATNNTVIGSSVTDNGVASADINGSKASAIADANTPVDANAPVDVSVPVANSTPVESNSSNNNKSIASSANDTSADTVTASNTGNNKKNNPINNNALTDEVSFDSTEEIRYDQGHLTQYTNRSISPLTLGSLPALPQEEFMTRWKMLSLFLMLAAYGIDSTRAQHNQEKLGLSYISNPNKIGAEIEDDGVSEASSPFNELDNRLGDDWYGDEMDNVPANVNQRPYTPDSHNTDDTREYKIVGFQEIADVPESKPDDTNTSVAPGTFLELDGEQGGYFQGTGSSIGIGSYIPEDWDHMAVTMPKNRSYGTIPRMFNILEVSMPDAYNDSGETSATSVSSLELSGDDEDDDDDESSNIPMGASHSLIEALDLCGANNFNRRFSNMGFGSVNAPEPDYGEATSNTKYRRLSLGSSFQLTQEEDGEELSTTSFNENAGQYHDGNEEIASGDDESAIEVSKLAHRNTSLDFEEASQSCNGDLDIENASFPITEDCIQSSSQIIIRITGPNSTDYIEIDSEHHSTPDPEDHPATDSANGPTTAGVEPQQPAIVCGHYAETASPAVVCGYYAGALNDCYTEALNDYYVEAPDDYSLTVPPRPKSARGYRPGVPRPSKRSPFHYLRNLDKKRAVSDPCGVLPTITEEQVSIETKTAEKASSLRPENWRLSSADPRDDPACYVNGKPLPPSHGSLRDAMESKAQQVTKRLARRYGLPLEIISHNV